MDKRRNVKKVGLIKGYLFVQDRTDNKKVYLVEQKDFDDPNKSGDMGINRLVLEYLETTEEYVYSIKYPDTIKIIQRGGLEGLIFID